MFLGVDKPTRYRYNYLTLLKYTLLLSNNQKEGNLI
ncbi:hypothetical protein [Salmonella phage PHA46]